MDEKTQAHRTKVQRGWLIYIGIITGLYVLFAICCVIQMIGLPLLSLAGFLVYFILIHGWITVWFHYILVACAVGYSIYCYVKDRQREIFVCTLLLAALNIVGSIGVQLFAGMAARQ